MNHDLQFAGGSIPLRPGYIHGDDRSGQLSNGNLSHWIFAILTTKVAFRLE